MIYEIIKLWGENTYQSEENSFIPTLTTTY